MAVMDYDSIKCPACGGLYEDENNRHVTHWGGTTHKLLCGLCEYVFTVEETVLRGYEIIDDGRPLTKAP